MTALLIWKWCFIPIVVLSFIGGIVYCNEGSSSINRTWPLLFWALLFIWIIFFTICGVIYA